MNTELYRPWFAHYEDFVPRTVEIWDKPLYRTWLRKPIQTVTP